ncbi:hypothetical protein FBR01_05455 [Anaerolineae bacterium CFX8]|nr:hypothetical protein [Anaerolineae bacterium CFX8]
MSRIIFTMLVLLLVFLPAAAQNDAVIITWPPPVYDVSGTISVIGTVNPPDLQAYFLQVSLYDQQPPAWIPASTLKNQPVVNGVLAEWPTTTVPDGIYQLRLQVRLRSGQDIFYTVGPIRVANALQRPEGETAVVPQPLPVLPTEAPTAPQLVPRPNPVNELPVPVGGQVAYFTDETIAAMKTAGMTWVKWQVPFIIGDTNLLNVARDRINWSHEAGFKVLLSITGEKQELAELNADYYPLYAEFLGQVAALGVDAIEVWNEMNIDREWPAGRISARSYVEMLRQAYEAIKAADPQVMVISGAPAPTGFFGGCSANGCDDGDYYWNLANAGVVNYADCIGVHYNEGILPPIQQGGDPRDNYPTRYFPLMTQRAAAPFRNSGIPLCYTEIGYLSPDGYGPLPAGFEWGASTSVQEQAEWLRDAIGMAAEFPNLEIALMIVFNVDFDVYDRDPQAGFAIIRPDGSCPACQTIGSLRGEG